MQISSHTYYCDNVFTILDPLYILEAPALNIFILFSTFVFSLAYCFNLICIYSYCTLYSHFSFESYNVFLFLLTTLRKINCTHLSGYRE